MEGPYVRGIFEGPFAIISSLLKPPPTHPPTLPSKGGTSQTVRRRREYWGRKSSSNFHVDLDWSWRPPRQPSTPVKISKSPAHLNTISIQIKVCTAHFSSMSGSNDLVPPLFASLRLKKALSLRELRGCMRVWFQVIYYRQGNTRKTVLNREVVSVVTADSPQSFT